MDGPPGPSAKSESGGRTAGRFALALLTVSLAAGLLLTLRPDRWGNDSPPSEQQSTIARTPTPRAAAKPVVILGSGATLFLVTSDADAATIGRAIESGYFAGAEVLLVPAAAEPFEIDALIASANAFRTRAGTPPLIVDMRVR